MAKAKKWESTRLIPKGKTQVNFNIKDESLKKVEDIAHQKRVSKSDIYNEAVEQYIEKFEKKEGKIKL
jgi:predicted transcriptional regulator